ncbi:MAG: oxidoreductase [Ilumatobacteraceae bacterium]|nr:oxidoreductase [Ilumatobacteraceae bacterium]
MTSCPRVGFLGVGWIGRDRMHAIARSDAVDIVMVADADPMAADRAAAETGAAVVDPNAIVSDSSLQGLVIATPSALHAQQAIAAFDAGMSVFCQKPLGRNATEAAAVVSAAAKAGQPLGVDLSYRHLAATRAMRRVVLDGELGEVFAADLTFHNAYGPDMPWFTDPELSGGGCVIDLGTHIVDLAQWMLPQQTLHVVSSQMYHKGRPVAAGDEQVEDYATVMLRTSSGATINLSCSWFLHAGRDAVIGAAFYGTQGSVELKNVGGSFYDFEARRSHSTRTEILASGPDDWGGRAAVHWARQLGLPPEQRDHHDPSQYIALAAIIDEVYGRCHAF